MTVTTTYLIDQLSSQTAYVSDVQSDTGDILGLTNGGRATATVVSGNGLLEIAFYDAAGNQVTTHDAGTDGSGGQFAQGTDGTVLMAITNGAGISVEMYSATGDFIANPILTDDANSSHADVAALADGQFVVAYQRAFPASFTNPDDHDIRFFICSADASSLQEFVVDASDANDQNASVVGLNGGGLAVAWERIDSGGNTTAWVAVYDNSGNTVGSGPHLIDNTGTINQGMQLAATADGGFSLTYEDNESGNSNINVVTFNDEGVAQRHADAVTQPNLDSGATIATLSNGMQIIAYTDQFGASDHDIRAALYDPATGNILTPVDNDQMLKINYTGDDTIDATVTAIGPAQFLVTYTNLTSGEVIEEHYQLTRVSVCDNAANGNLIDGDDAVDLETGGSARDTLNGGGNDDVLNGRGNDDNLNAGSGNDIVNGGVGDDFIDMGANFTASDRIDGGADYDTVRLSGDYHAGVTFAADTMINVENLSILGAAVGGGHVYKLTTADATVAAGNVLTIEVVEMGVGDRLIFNGSHESDGGFAFITGDFGKAGAEQDTITGGRTTDNFFMHDSLTAIDAVNGGAGFDSVFLDGDYHLGVTFGAKTMTNVEYLQVESGHSYKLITNDATVAKGKVLTVDGSALDATDRLTFDGSAEKNGAFNITGGNGDDVLTGGMGDDQFFGHDGTNIFHLGRGGSDAAVGGTGTDTFVAVAALNSGDAIDGGGGNDTLTLDGDYSAGVIFTSTTMVNVENIVVAAGHSYVFTLNNATIAAHETLTIDGTSLGTGDRLIVAMQAGSDGILIAKGGAGADDFSDGIENDRLIGGGGADFIDIFNGGDDTVNAGKGADNIYAYRALTAGDKIDGGKGFDTLNLSGDYSVGVAFGAHTLRNVENITLATGNSYTLTTSDGTVASKAVLTVDGSQLASTNRLAFDGHLETDGTLMIIGGAGGDNLTGGQKNDHLFGNGGSDLLDGSAGGSDTITGGAGNDEIHMGGALNAGDKIDGGTENDTVILSGSQNVTFNATTMINVEHILLSAGSDYTLKIADQTIAAGHILSVDGSALGNGDVLVFDGSKETDSQMLVFGGAGDDVLTGGRNADTLNGNGGNDTLRLTGFDVASGGTGDDTFKMNGTMNSDTRIDGGADLDTLVLNGNYTGSNSLIFSATTMTGVEQLELVSGHSYTLTMDDAQVAKNGILTVFAGQLGVHDVLMFNASNETNGDYTVLSGAGDDVIATGAGNDTIRGGKGSDTLTPGLGRDTLIYDNVNQSTGAAHDTVIGFNANVDKIDLPFAVGAVDTAIVAGNLRALSFNSDLEHAVDAAHLASHHAVLFTASTGDLAGHTFLVIDANGTAGYQHGADFVIALEGGSHLSSLSSQNFGALT